MSEKRNVPELRFQGFTDHWKNSSLGEISSQVGYGMNSSAIDYDGVHKYIRITDIDENSRSFIPSPLTSPDGEINPKYKLGIGDILFARTGASVGKSYLYDPSDGEVYFAGFLIRFSIQTESPYFIYLQTVSQKYRKWVSIMSMRSGQPGINAEEYKTFPIAIPSLSEQQKIAEFLTAVDKRIALLEQKKEKLEAYKKGVMQQLFTQKIRFKQDDGSEFPNWEEKKLGECGDFYGGGTPDSSNENFWQGKIPWISSSDITENSIFSVSKTRYISETAIAQSATKIVPPRSVLIVTRVGVGKIGYTEESVCTSQDFTSILPSENLDPIFLAYQLHLMNSKIKGLSQGTSIKGVTMEDVKNMKLAIPTKIEQGNIVQFLTSLDTSIENINQQINYTQTWKKGLLQKMFV